MSFLRHKTESREIKIGAEKSTPVLAIGLSYSLLGCSPAEPNSALLNGSKVRNQIAQFNLHSHIILDLLSNREPHYTPSAYLFSEADKGKTKIYVSSLSFSNLNYILSKLYSPDQARKKLLKFKTLVLQQFNYET